jgi:hypothetical protein
MTSTPLETIEEEEIVCQDCKKAPATSRFVHLHNGEFFLCEVCFLAADHKSDYGEDFDYSDQEDDQSSNNDGFIDPGEQDDDFNLYVGINDGYDEDDDFDREIMEMMLDGSYQLLTQVTDSYW